jgi:chromosome segregation ATPase
MMMKKILSVSLLTTSLLVNGVGIIHAEEQSEAQQKWKQTPEYQAIQTLQEQRKQLNAQLKAQGEQNRAAWEALWSGVPQEVRETVKSVMNEIKPLREENKQLAAALKEAKQAKDEERIREIKAKLEANHQAIEAKLAPIQSEWEQIKELRNALKETKSQVKPIREEKKANHQKVVELRADVKETMKNAKEAYKNGQETEWKDALGDAADLLEQLIAVKTEILSQKQAIYDILK